jgi:beta-lactam-binding protein with PASTA domain
MKPTLALLLAIAAVACLAGCGSAPRRHAPNVTGLQLDAAEGRLDALGLHYDTSGGGDFGIVIRSNWTVCRQSPAPHRVASTVVLSVARSCSTPYVVGQSLGDAEDTLDQAGVPYSEEGLDGEPIVVESNWAVCSQSPRGGGPARPVHLFVSRDCFSGGGIE